MSTSCVEPLLISSGIRRRSVMFYCKLIHNFLNVLLYCYIVNLRAEYLCRRRRHEIDVIAATGDGEVFIWDYTSRDLVNKISVHSSPVSGVCFVLSGDRVVTACDDGDMRVTDLSVLDSVSIFLYFCGFV